MGNPEDRPPFKPDDRTAVWKYSEPWSDVWCAGAPAPVAADSPQRWVAVDEHGSDACYPACPAIGQVFDHVPVRAGRFSPDPDVVWRLLDDPDDESVGEAVEMRLEDRHTGEAWRLVRRYEAVGGEAADSAACVCAVCAGRPCACDVEVLAGLLREAADFPLPGGAAVVSVRAAAEAARRGNDRAH